MFVTFSVHEFLIWCALIDSALLSLSVSLPPLTHCSFLTIYYYCSLFICWCKEGGEDAGQSRHIVERRAAIDVALLWPPLWYSKPPNGRHYGGSSASKCARQRWNPTGLIQDEQWGFFLAGKIHDVATMTPTPWRAGLPHVASSSQEVK